MTHQQLFDSVINCYVFIKELNTTAFNYKLFPSHIDVTAYTNSSIIFKYKNVKYYGSYDWTIKGFTFKNI
jgi:hypothetical protein